MKHILNKEQFRRIKDHNIDYFRENEFSIEEKEEILNLAVSYGKIDIIKLYMEQGFKITKSTSLLELMSKNSKTDLLDYLESKGVDFADNDNILLLTSIQQKNLKFAQYLAQRIKISDTESVATAIKFTVIKFNDDIEKTKKLLTPILKNISSDNLNATLEQLDDYQYATSKKFVFNEFLKVTLNESGQKSRKIKI